MPFVWRIKKILTHPSPPHRNSLNISAEKEKQEEEDEEMRQLNWFC